ncbi:MAG: hypothetical protein AB7U63_07355 [Porticoccaceae bacterium]
MKISAKKTVSSATQKGVAILAITILLLLVATIGTLMVGRVGLQEQKVVGIDVRSKEVYSAAVGGLEYGVAWFADNFESLVWNGATAGSIASPDALANTVLNADAYGHTITYTAVTPINPADETMPIIVRVTSQAAAVGDSHINKTVSTEVMLGRTSIFSRSSGGADITAFQAPPIVVEGCTNAFTGTPDVFVPNVTPLPLAIGSTAGSGANCLDPGHLDQFACTGSTCTGVPTQTRILEEPTSLWVSIFGATTKADLLALEAREPQRIIIVDQNYPKYPTGGNRPSWNGNNWPGGTYGSPDNPIILLFDENLSDPCPGMQGGVTIYGIVYYETDRDKDTSPSCFMNGLGNVTIYGSLVKEGNMSRLNANIDIVGDNLDFGGGGGGSGSDNTIDIGIAIPQFSEIPGSWRDF